MEPLQQETLDRLAEIIGWAGAGAEAFPLPGDHFNRAEQVILQLDVSERRLLVKRYAPFPGDREKKAFVEFQALGWMKAGQVPVPEPVFLDQHGEVFGCPAIVTGWVGGRQIFQPKGEGDRWAVALAQTLAAIHATPTGTSAREFLLDANREATWFLKGRQAPDFMKSHPHGPQVWQVVKQQIGDLVPNPSGLVHIDYWPGNVLWSGGRIAAVIDWEEAAFGDPAIDVAYARMEMALSGLPEAAEIFRLAYEQASGRPLQNLAFWELAASARPMYDPAWEKDVRPQLHRFINRALKEIEGHT